MVLRGPPPEPAGDCSTRLQHTMAAHHKLAVLEAMTTGPHEDMEYSILLSLLRKRTCHLLERLADKALQQLAHSCLHDGIGIMDQQKIMKEADDDYPPYMWFVYRGSVEVKDMKENCLLSTLDAGGCVGEFSLISGKARGADAFAKGPAVVFKIG